MVMLTAMVGNMLNIDAVVVLIPLIHDCVG